MKEAAKNLIPREKLIRRVVILCCHCLRNFSFYTGGFHNGKLIYNDQFWVTANGNFLDICILEWCKLFADPKGRHHWRKVIKKEAIFLDGLLNDLNISESELADYTDKVRTYRDKFIAHLDHGNMMHIPQMNIALSSVCYLFDYLRNQEKGNNILNDAPTSASQCVHDLQKDIGKYIDVR